MTQNDHNGAKTTIKRLKTTTNGPKINNMRHKMRKRGKNYHKLLQNDYNKTDKNGNQPERP